MGRPAGTRLVLLGRLRGKTRGDPQGTLRINGFDTLPGGAKTMADNHVIPSDDIKYSQVIDAPDEHEEREGRSLVTRNHVELHLPGAPLGRSR